VASSYSQSTEVLDPDLNRRSEFFAIQYERLLTTAMTKYYKPNSFLVDTRVTLDEMLIPSEKVMQTNVPAVENLPGLPVLPDEMRKSQEALSDYRKEYGIKFIDVNVLVDSSYKLLILNSF
jgi:hypothetical protein